MAVLSHAGIWLIVSNMLAVAMQVTRSMTSSIKSFFIEMASGDTVLQRGEE